MTHGLTSICVQPISQDTFVFSEDYSRNHFVAFGDVMIARGLFLWCFFIVSILF